MLSLRAGSAIISWVVLTWRETDWHRLAGWSTEQSGHPYEIDPSCCFQIIVGHELATFVHLSTCPLVHLSTCPLALGGVTEVKRLARSGAGPCPCAHHRGPHPQPDPRGRRGLLSQRPVLAPRRRRHRPATAAAGDNDAALLLLERLRDQVNRESTTQPGCEPRKRSVTARTLRPWLAHVHCSVAAKGQRAASPLTPAGTPSMTLISSSVPSGMTRNVLIVPLPMFSV
jgi:hypothetical protein